MYAVVSIAGKQFKVGKNDKISVPTLKSGIGDKLSFDKVLLLDDDKTVHVGTPLVRGAKVEATVLAHTLGDKVVVFKKKKRKGYRVKRGHRQAHTQIQITNIAS